MIGITDEAGNLVGSTKYDAYGGELDVTGYMSAPAGAGGELRFHGMWQESETGLYYVRARDCDATTGRFLVPDPAEPDLLQPESLNRYQFANGNPYVYSDPTGRFFASLGAGLASGLRTIASDVIYDFLLDKATSVVGSVVQSALRYFPALQQYVPGICTASQQGLQWERDVQDFVCRLLPGSTKDYVWFEPVVRDGRAWSDGRSCGGGGGSGRRVSGSALPDVLLSGKPPSELGPGRDLPRHKAYLLVEVKLCIKTMYNAWAYRGGRRINQLRQFAIFAQKRVWSRTIVLMALLDGTNRAQRNELRQVICREVIRRKVIPLMVSAQ